MITFGITNLNNKELLNYVYHGLSTFRLMVVESKPSIHKKSDQSLLCKSGSDSCCNKIKIGKKKSKTGNSPGYSISINNDKHIVMISGDGDYIKLIRHLTMIKKFKKIIFPNKHYFSLYKPYVSTYSMTINTKEIREK